MFKFNSSKERAISLGYIFNKELNEFEHRLVWKRQGAYPLFCGWVVHHIDEDKKNNKIENLIALPAVLHHCIHVEQRLKNFRFTKEELLIKCADAVASARKNVKKPRRKKGKKRQLPFFVPNFAADTWPFVDIDYFQSLSLDDRQWLTKFLQEYYNGFVTSPSLHPIETKKQRSRVFSARGPRRRDIWNQGTRCDVKLNTLADESSWKGFV